MGTLTVFYEEEVLAIKNEWCKGCGLCVSFCKKEVLAMSMQGKALIKKPENCVQCGLCEMYCPDFAITMWRPEHETTNPAAAR